MRNKRMSSLFIIMVLIFSLLPAMPINAKVKLNTTYKTLNIGKTATIKISGTKKNVNWSVSNSHIRITKQTKTYAKIKGMSKGTSYLKAKVGSKTYKCKVVVKVTSTPTNNNVKSNFDPKKAKSSMNIDRFIANKSLFVRIKSNYKYATNISAKCTFYDSNGKPVDYSNDTISFLEKGHTCFLEFSLPDASFSRYEIKYEYSEGLEYFYHLSVIKNLSLSTNYVEDEYSPYIMLQVSNSGKEECYHCEVAVVYYDVDENIIDVKLETIGKIPSGSSETKKAYTPYDKKTYDDLAYDHYEAFITYAYHLGKAGETH